MSTEPRWSYIVHFAAKQRCSMLLKKQTKNNCWSWGLKKKNKKQPSSAKRVSSKWQKWHETSKVKAADVLPWKDQNLQFNDPTNKQCVCVYQSLMYLPPPGHRPPLLPINYFKHIHEPLLHWVTSNTHIFYSILFDSVPHPMMSFCQE